MTVFIFKDSGMERQSIFTVGHEISWFFSKKLESIYSKKCLNNQMLGEMQLLMQLISMFCMFVKCLLVGLCKSKYEAILEQMHHWCLASARYQNGVRPLYSSFLVSVKDNGRAWDELMFLLIEALQSIPSECGQQRHLDILLRFLSIHPSSPMFQAWCQTAEVSQEAKIPRSMCASLWRNRYETTWITAS